MKLKHLQTHLEDLEGFRDPQIELEQYPTGAHLASQMLYNAYGFGDIEDKVVVDLGCGCGVLSIAAVLMGAGHAVGIDIDPGALEVAQENIDGFEDLHIDLVQCSVDQLGGLGLKADTVLMNPPFGTRRKGADMEFLRAGFALAGVKAVYSLNKTSTRAHIEKVAKELKAKRAEVVAEMVYDIPASYKFHKEKSKNIAVDMWRFELPQPE
mmetsp:Transcript_22413/g.37482  ORF Transcript_22413/g.37482 Transcript_22413/m.37482 type:complete len:210 (+) Transcript_22413:430-1059(+)|eukprot:CAMPEP_0198205678 /NCGR_PEP_ID=MMETSP1445-20131203/9207_1 /TAXON_ID=36898 /ORGANISM="Pyramimonas sp., Strain CCMP2087" /LENGTH=209 /DNA_ID=CAMNT_0043878061 /DNA_START=425 /DNA_END=1054 /DNA_ORIENTATION=-